MTTTNTPLKVSLTAYPDIVVEYSEIASGGLFTVCVDRAEARNIYCKVDSETALIVYNDDSLEEYRADKSILIEGNPLVRRITLRPTYPQIDKQQEKKKQWALAKLEQRS